MRIHIRSGLPKRNDTQLSGKTTRRGAALLEVLMALGVMAVGVLSVMTLFPLSVRKALEASQKTNTSILKMQFEQLLTAYPQILPINDRTVHVPGNQSQNLFPLGTQLGTTRIRVVDPRGVYAAKLYNRGIPNPPGYPNYTYPPINDTGNPIAAMLFPPKFRTHAGLYLDEVDQFTTLQDSWNTNTEFFLTTAITNNATSSVINLPAGESIINAISEIPTALPTDARVRLMISDASGKQFQLRGNVLKTGTAQLTVSPPLPASYSNALTCRLQVFEPRYSWMVTTKTTLVGYGPDNTSGTADDVVETDAMLIIFFRRNLSDLAEETFSGTNLSTDRTQIDLTAPVGIPIKVDAGSYIFDAETGEWYQVMSVTGTTPYVVTLDRPFYVRPGLPAPFDKLVIYENIMGAYPLGRFWTGL